MTSCRAQYVYMCVDCMYIFTCPAVPATTSLLLYLHRLIFWMPSRGSSLYGSKQPTYTQAYVYVGIRWIYVEKIIHRLYFGARGLCLSTSYSVFPVGWLLWMSYSLKHCGFLNVHDRKKGWFSDTKSLDTEVTAAISARQRCKQILWHMICSQPMELQWKKNTMCIYARSQKLGCIFSHIHLSSCCYWWSWCMFSSKLFTASRV